MRTFLSSGPKTGEQRVLLDRSAHSVSDSPAIVAQDSAGSPARRLGSRGSERAPDGTEKEVRQRVRRAGGSAPAPATSRPPLAPATRPHAHPSPHPPPRV